jgi:predicted nucleic acid-binding protein
VTIAIDTNVLVRLLVRDDEVQHAAAQRLVDEAAAAEEPVLIVLCALLEPSGCCAAATSSTRQASLAHSPRCSKAPTWSSSTRPPWKRLSMCGPTQHPGADFADCPLSARAAHLGRRRFLTFDAGAARLPGVELLA